MEIFPVISAALTIAGTIALCIGGYLTVRSSLNKSTLDLLQTRSQTLFDELQDARSEIRVLREEVRVVRQLPLEHISKTLNELMAAQTKMIETQNIILRKLGE